MTSVFLASMTPSAKCCIPGLQRCANFLKNSAAIWPNLRCAGFTEPDLPPQQLVMPTELIRRESVRHVSSGHTLLTSVHVHEKVL